MPNPVTPSRFCQAIPSANADMCEKFTKWLNIPSLLCDLFSWMFNSDGTPSTEFQQQVGIYSVPTGAVIASVTLNMGTGWLLCDGSEVSRTTYAALFSVVGTRYGDGDASTTFNLPDLRGRSVIGAGLGSGLTNRDINTVTVGEERHTQTIAEMPVHHHTFNGPTTRVEERGDGANVVWRGTQNEDTQDTGSGNPFNVIHPCVILYHFVKT